MEYINVLLYLLFFIILYRRKCNKVAILATGIWLLSTVIGLLYVQMPVPIYKNALGHELTFAPFLYLFVCFFVTLLPLLSSKEDEAWLRAFMDSELIVTDSFHACVFSLIFNKPFNVFGNKGRGMSRFDSLLKLFDCEYRLVGSYNDISEKHFRSPDIDKSKAYQASVSFLKNAINKNYE